VTFKRAAGIALATLILWPQALVAAETPLIAVLQEEKPDSVDAAIRAEIRVAFREQNGDWIPVCRETSQPDSRAACAFAGETPAHWQVVLHGRDVGVVQTRDWLERDAYAGIGLLRVFGDEIPHAGPRTTEFAGWAGVPVHRPLIAFNVRRNWNVRWRNSYPADTPTASLLSSMRKLVPTVPACTQNGDRRGPGRPLVAADIHVTELWKAPRGERLIGASLKTERVKPCEYDFDLVADSWFYDDGKSPVRALPALASNDTTHRLVDIGDFAGNGHEEALFWLSGYDEDGFILLFDGFRKSARFAWTYH
jgi:hypothetical protein